MDVHEPHHSSFQATRFVPNDHDLAWIKAVRPDGVDLIAEGDPDCTGEVTLYYRPETDEYVLWRCDTCGRAYRGTVAYERTERPT